MTSNNNAPDDEANKALVVRCADALVTVTFAGVGGWGADRLDRVLADEILKKGLPELELQHLLDHIQTFGPQWLQRDPLQPHIFTVAGWNTLEVGSLPTVWRISNMSGAHYRRLSDGTITPPPDKVFTIVPTGIARNQTKMVGAGLVEGISRASRRRIDAALRKPSDLARLERSIVDAVRGAASDPRTSFGVSEDVMAVVLSRTGEAYGSLYRASGKVVSNGPSFVWYGGGQNVWIDTPSLEPAHGYGSFLVGDPPGVVARPRSGVALAHLDVGDEVSSVFGMQVNPAVHRTHEPVREFTFFSLQTA